MVANSFEYFVAQFSLVVVLEFLPFATTKPPFLIVDGIAPFIVVPILLSN